MSIKTRLLTGFGAILCLFLMLGWFSYTKINNVLGGTQNLYEHPFEVSNRIRHFMEDTRLIQGLLREALLTPDPVALESLHKEIGQQEKAQLENLNVIQEKFLGDKKAVERLRSEFLALHFATDKVFAMCAQGLQAKALGVVKKEGDGRVDGILNSATLILDFAIDKAQIFFAETRESAQSGYHILAIAFVLCFGVIAAIAILTSLSLLAPFGRIIAFAKKVQTGQYAERIGLERDDEFGLLCATLDGMATSIQDHAANLENRVAHRTAELNAANQQLMASEQQLKAANQQLMASEQQLKATNQQLMASEQQLKATNQQLKISHQQLLQTSRLASIGELAAGVGHEINNPLTVLLGNINRMSRDFKSDRHAQTIAICLRSIERIKNIVDSLRTYAQGMKESDDIVIDIHKTIKDSLLFVEEIFLKDGVAIKLDLQACVHHTKGNAGRLQQVIINFLTNAKDACTKGHGLIHIGTRDAEDKIKIVFTDNGSGIPPQLMSKIFDPFFTTKKVGEGTGLGLGISRAIVEQMGGSLQVESSTGVGTSFFVYLNPLQFEGRAQKSPDHLVENNPKMTSILAGDILIVDDEEGIRALLLEELREMGFKVWVASNGVEALQRLEARKYDCMITDIKMPEMDGRELIHKMKALGRQEKIVVITGGVLEDRFQDHGDVTRQSVAGFIQKPFDRAEIEKLLGHIMATI